MEATIYIADQRGCSNKQKERLWSTFNYEDFYHPDKEPFGALTQLNEFHFFDGHQVNHWAGADTYQLIIPLHGELKLQCQNWEHILTIGEMACISVDKPCGLTISTADKEEKFGAFIQLAIQSEQALAFDFERLALPVDKIKNRMIALTGQYYPFTFYMGAFSGRSEFRLACKQALADAFVYCLEGAFEVEGRLLYAGDGLALKQLAGLDIECLSQAGMLLMVE